MAGNQKFVALSIFSFAGAALAAAFFMHNPAAIQDLSTAKPPRANGEDKNSSSLPLQPESTSGEARNMLQPEPSENRGAVEDAANDASDNSSKNGIDALESDLPMMKVAELFQRLTDGIEGNPVAFNSRYGNTRFKFIGTFMMATGPDEQGLYSLTLSEFAVCSLSQSQRGELENLKSGDVVALSGVPYMYTPGIPIFMDCRILSISESNQN